MSTMTLAVQDRSSRWLLVGSLALNLFFIGTIGALAVRHYVVAPQPAAMERPRTAAGRIERLAAPLPAADAEKLRAAFKAREGAAEGQREALNRAFERLQAAMRAQLFDPAQLRTALAEVRSARVPYEQTMQEIYLAAAGAMSAEGRAKLADGPSPRPGPPR